MKITKRQLRKIIHETLDPEHIRDRVESGYGITQQHRIAVEDAVRELFDKYVVDFGIPPADVLSIFQEFLEGEAQMQMDLQIQAEEGLP